MKNKIVSISVIAILVLLGAGAVALKNNNDKNMSKGTTADHDNSSGRDAETVESDVESTSETNEVTYRDFEVVQKSIKIKKGTTVTWTNEDSAKHDVTPENETDDFKASELFGKGETYSHTFNTVGKFNYFCSPHPYMKGTIEVTE